MWARSEATDPGSAWQEWNHGGPDVVFFSLFFLGKGTNSQRSQAALCDFLYFRNPWWSRWFRKKKKSDLGNAPSPRLPLWWWSCGRLQSHCGGVRKAVKPEILLLVLGSAWNNTSWKTFGGSSARSQAMANLYSFTAQRPLDERAYFIDFMLSLLPV